MNHDEQPKKAKPEIALDTALPATPLTTLGTPEKVIMMDSEDEFMSEASTEDFGAVEDSDDGSLGKNAETPFVIFQLTVHFARLRRR